MLSTKIELSLKVETSSHYTFTVYIYAIEADCIAYALLHTYILPFATIWSQNYRFNPVTKLPSYETSLPAKGKKSKNNTKKEKKKGRYKIYLMVLAFYVPVGNVPLQC